MPTSAPGISSRRGFTLIELLIVLLVMGLAAGLIGALVHPDERALLRVESERLDQLLELAAAESSLTGKPIAFTAEISKYAFWRWRDGAGWTEAREELRARNLPAGMTISGARIEFDPYVPTAYEVQMSLGAEQARVHEPR
jgi:general secretion pathway protein H